MKQKILFAIVVTLLLAACTARSGPSGIPPTTAPTTVPTTAPTTEPTVPSQPTVLTEEEQFQKLIIDGVLHDGAGGRAADLTLVEENAQHDPFHGTFQISVLKQNDVYVVILA